MTVKIQRRLILGAKRFLMPRHNITKDEAMKKITKLLSDFQFGEVFDVTANIDLGIISSLRVTEKQDRDTLYFALNVANTCMEYGRNFTIFNNEGTLTYLIY